MGDLARSFSNVLEKFDPDKWDSEWSSFVDLAMRPSENPRTIASVYAGGTGKWVGSTEG